MITLNTLSIAKEPSLLYLPVTPYINALVYILESNENEYTKQCKIRKTTIANMNENLDKKTYWANELSNALYGESDHFMPESLWGIETPFDAKSLFNLLVKAIKSDKDVKKYIKDYDVKTHDIETTNIA